MRMYSAHLMLAVSLLLMNGFCHPQDLCAFNHPEFSDMSLINGNFSYMGMDLTNNNKSYWHSECYEFSIEWGNKYNFGNRYIIKYKYDNTSYYVYCGINELEPTDCNGNWYIWDGNSFILDTKYTIHYCTYYTVCIHNFIHHFEYIFPNHCL